MTDAKSAHLPPTTPGRPAVHPGAANRSPSAVAHPQPVRRPADSGDEFSMDRRPTESAQRNIVRAAWAQAIGSILALIAAFIAGALTVHSTRTIAEEERQTEAAILSAGIGSDLEYLKTSFDRVLDAQQSVLTDPDRLLNVMFVVPPELAATRGRLYLLGRESGLAVQRTINDAQRVARLLEFIRKDARAYADYYAKRGIVDNSGAGTAFYFNARDFDMAVQSLSGNLASASRLLNQAGGD